MTLRFMRAIRSKINGKRVDEGRSVSARRYLGVCCFFSSLSSICYQHYNQSNCHHNYDECHHFYCNYCGHLLFSLRVQRGMPRLSACSLVLSEVGMQTMSFSSPDFNCKVYVCICERELMGVIVTRIKESE